MTKQPVSNLEQTLFFSCLFLFRLTVFLSDKVDVVYFAFRVDFVVLYLSGHTSGWGGKREKRKFPSTWKMAALLESALTLSHLWLPLGEKQTNKLLLLFAFHHSLPSHTYARRGRRQPTKSRERHRYRGRESWSNLHETPAASDPVPRTDVVIPHLRTSCWNYIRNHATRKRAEHWYIQRKLYRNIWKFEKNIRDPGKVESFRWKSDKNYKSYQRSLHIVKGKLWRNRKGLDFLA